MENNINNIIITDDQDNNNVIYDISDRIYELRDDLSLDILSRNILDMFETNNNYETTNYVTKFKEKYLQLKELNAFDGDEDILNQSLQELTELILANLKVKFKIGVGNDIDGDLIFDLTEYLEKVETVYNFFIVRHYTNIKDYFKYKLLQNKMDFIERYKTALDDKTYDDLFLSQDKKKYVDVSDAIIIHFINDIISDIKSEVHSGYDFFKEIVNLDLYEEYNNRMYELLCNYGTDFFIENDQDAADAYLEILNDNEIFVSLRNELLEIYKQDVKLSDR